MIWSICFFAALAVLVLCGVLLGLIRKGRIAASGAFRPFNILFAGVVVAAIIIFIPICSSHPHEGGFFVTLLLSLHNMLRLFVIDGELTFMVDALAGIPEWLNIPYFLLSSLLFFAAPMITFGFVLSFCKNAAATWKYLLNYRRDLYAFSHLNEKSVTLAESIRETRGRCLFVFCDVDPDRMDELFERAKQLNASCFSKDLTALKLHKHSKNSHIYIFAIGEDESENVDRAYSIVKKYGDRSNMDLYVVSAQPKAEALLGVFSDTGMHLHRVNEVRSFLYNELYQNGFHLFADAQEQDGVRQIGAVIVGLKPYGYEMAKTRPWFCQMDGYRVQIHAFDDEPEAEHRFRAACPELLDDAHNGKFDDDGEAQYLLCVEAGVDYESDRLLQSIEALDPVTYTFIDTGDDARNVRLALRLRILYERMGIHPRIVAILRNPNDAEMLAHVRDYSGNEYDIHFAGDSKACYCADVILHSELEQAALRRHLKWGSEQSFWMYEHNYRASMASAIHSRMKQLCGMPGADLPKEERSEAQKLRLRKLEHRRWNAYTRSEGFVYSGSTEKSSRNNLGKMHNCLVTFDLLSEADRPKDDD